jgi:hypothetical protein
MVNITASLAPADAPTRRLARQELLLDLVRIAVRCGVVLGGGMGDAAEAKTDQPAPAHAPHHGPDRHGLDPHGLDPHAPRSHRRDDLRGRHAIGTGSRELEM